MYFLLTLAYLFLIGSTMGWVLELLWRNLTMRNPKWVNPGFCTGPYLPIYGFGLCVLYMVALLERFQWIENPLWNKALLFAAMAAAMTEIEYAAGVFCLKYLKVRLWDYSDLWGNVQGIICPAFSLAWAILGALYYFLIHPHILEGLDWLSRNLAFSFFIGMFFGIFIVDVCHSAQIVVKLKSFAEEQKIVLRYETIKEHIRDVCLERSEKYHFFTPFRSHRPLNEHLQEMIRSAEHHLR